MKAADSRKHKPSHHADRGISACPHAGLPLTVNGTAFKTRGDEEFLIFGMAPTDADHPIYLYEELIEPTLGAGAATGRPCPRMEASHCVHH